MTAAAGYDVTTPHNFKLCPLELFVLHTRVHLHGQANKVQRPAHAQACRITSSRYFAASHVTLN